LEEMTARYLHNAGLLGIYSLAGGRNGNSAFYECGISESSLGNKGTMRFVTVEWYTNLSRYTPRLLVQLWSTSGNKNGLYRLQFSVSAGVSTYRTSTLFIRAIS
jgi:hypothetical protein